MDRNDRLLSSAVGRIIIAVDLDYFYAQSEEIRRPELKGKPLVICVFSGRTEISGAVSTANYAARGLGVKSGMPIALAKKILSKRADATFLPLDSEYYEALSEKVMKIIGSHSSKFEQVSIDEAFIDVTDPARQDYGSAFSIGAAIKREIMDKEKLTASVGIGPNKTIAKMAADFKKPDGLFMLRPEEVKSFLAPLGVRELPGIGPKTEKVLLSLGITNLGDLASAEEKLLADALGKNLGPELKNLAQGIDESPVQERETEQFSRIITLKKNADAFDFQSEIIPLCEDISSRLKLAKLKCKNVGIIVITTELKTKSKGRSMKEATDSKDVIMSLAASLFTEYFASAEVREKKESARRVGIRVSSLVQAAEKSEGTMTLTDYA